MVVQWKCSDRKCNGAGSAKNEFPLCHICEGPVNNVPRTPRRRTRSLSPEGAARSRLRSPRRNLEHDTNETRALRSRPRSYERRRPVARPQGERNVPASGLLDNAFGGLPSSLRLPDTYRVSSASGHGSSYPVPRVSPFIFGRPLSEFGKSILASSRGGPACVSQSISSPFGNSILRSSPFGNSTLRSSPFGNPTSSASAFGNSMSSANPSSDSLPGANLFDSSMFSVNPFRDSLSASGAPSSVLGSSLSGSTASGQSLSMPGFKPLFVGRSDASPFYVPRSNADALASGFGRASRSIPPSSIPVEAPQSRLFVTQSMSPALDLGQVSRSEMFDNMIAESRLPDVTPGSSSRSLNISETPSSLGTQPSGSGALPSSSVRPSGSIPPFSFFVEAPQSGLPVNQSGPPPPDFRTTSRSRSANTSARSLPPSLNIRDAPGSSLATEARLDSIFTNLSQSSVPCSPTVASAEVANTTNADAREKPSSRTSDRRTNTRL